MAVTAALPARSESPFTAVTRPYLLTRLVISTASPVLTHASLEAIARLLCRRLAGDGQGGIDQRLEQPRVVPGLRVPLHREQEPGPVPGLPVRLRRLDRAVVRPGGRDQPVAEPADGLMMRGGHGRGHPAGRAP